MKTITAQTISFAQIQALRSEAASAQDFMQVAICDLALAGSVDADDYTTLSRSEDRRLRSMTRDDAYEACAQAIGEAAAQA